MYVCMMTLFDVCLRNQTNSLEKDLLNAAHKYEDLRRLKENMQRERDTLRSDIVKLNNQIANLRHTIMMQNNNIDNLRLDINKLNVKLDEAKISISKAEKQRDEMAKEVDALHERIENYQGKQAAMKIIKIHFRRTIFLIQNYSFFKFQIKYN